MDTSPLFAGGDADVEGLGEEDRAGEGGFVVQAHRAVFGRADLGMIGG